jgi:hypothetical protein
MEICSSAASAERFFLICTDRKHISPVTHRCLQTMWPQNLRPKDKKEFSQLVMPGDGIEPPTRKSSRLGFSISH